MNTNEIVISALRSKGYRPTSYSGRGMSSRRCMGVVTDDSAGTLCLNLAAQLLTDIESKDAQNIIEELADYGTSEDSMGLKSIIYFQGMTWDAACEAAAGSERDDDYED